MNRQTHAVVTLAAATLLGSGIFVLAADPGTGNPPADQGNTPAVQSGAAGQHGMTPGQNDMMAGQQITQELRQFAQDPQTAPDKMFLLNMAVDSMCEVQLSQQAAQHAENDQVKTLAQHMVTDHTQLDQKLAPIAQQAGVQVPSDLPEMRKAEIDVFAALPPKTFDQQFLAHLNAAHLKAIACFQAEAANSTNPQVKQFASENVATLQQHLQMIRQTASTIGLNLGENEATPAAAHMPGGNGTHMDVTGGNGANAPGAQTPTK